jgi:hypothetical protein
VSSIGTPGSATYAQTLSGIEEMLTVLPDNLANEITAQNVRDVVYTLYEDLQGMSASQFVYTDSPATVNVGGITAGQVFASMSLQTLFNKLFHKDYPPSGTLTANPSQLDYGNTDTVLLTWKATKATYDLVQNSGSITRSPIGTTILITIPFVTGGTNNVTDTPAINQTNIYTFTFKDTQGNTVNAPASVGYYSRWYYGNRPNRNQPTPSEVRSLSSYGSGAFGSGRGFSKNFTGVNDIGGGNNYIMWAFPSSWGTPIFKTTGGLPWTGPKLEYTISYTNLFNYTEDYDVWITQDPYNSVYNQFVIS